MCTSVNLTFVHLAYFDQQQHTLTLPTVSSVTCVLRFLEKLCHSLQCDPLFCSQPVAGGGVRSNSRTCTPGWYWCSLFGLYRFLCISLWVGSVWPLCMWYINATNHVMKVIESNGKRFETQNRHRHLSDGWGKANECSCVASSRSSRILIKRPHIRIEQQKATSAPRLQL